MGNIFMRIAAVSISAVLVAGLSGCGGGSDPAPSTSPSTTPSPVPQTTAPTESLTPSETPTVETVRPQIDIPEPEKYPPMAYDDINGASTAARYFLDLYGYVYETGNLSTWNRISDENCEICASVSADVESEYAQGHWFENFALLHGKSIVYYPSERAPYYLVVLDVQFTDYEVYDNVGALIKHENESHYPRFAVGVKYVGPNDWILVTETEQQEPGTAADDDKFSNQKGLGQGSRVEAVSVHEAAAAAAINYLLHIPSLNCFAPEDFDFQCLEEAEDSEPDDAPNDTNPIATMTPAEFNTIMHTEFARLHVTGSGLDFQPNNGEGIIGTDPIQPWFPIAGTITTTETSEPITHKKIPNSTHPTRPLNHLQPSGLAILGAHVGVHLVEHEQKL